MKGLIASGSLAFVPLCIGVAAWLLAPPAAAIQDRPVSYWREEIRERGAENAYARMVEGVAGLIDNDQHLTAHKFGNALYEELGLKGVSVCDHVYGQGCFHQFFMTSLFDRGESVVREFSDACYEALRGGDNIRACNHGLGHGVMVAFEERGLQGALDACATIEERQAFLGCIDGVYMEYFTPTHTGRDIEKLPVRAFDAAAPYEPCSELGEDFQPTCYYMLSSWWIFKGVSFDDAAALCRGIPGGNRDACLTALGHVIGIASDYDRSKALAKCASLAKSSRDEISCRAGAHFVFSRAAEIGVVIPQEERQLCDFNDADSRSRCLEQADMIYTPIGISVICCHQKL